MKKMAVCGTYVPSKYELQIDRLSIAGSRFINNITTGLSKYYDISILSYIGVPVDQYIQDLLSKEKGSYSFRSRYRIIGWIRYAIILVKEIKKAEIVMTYNLEAAWLIAPIITKIFHRKTVLLIADYTPPIQFDSSIRKLYAGIQKWLFKKYDYVIGLSASSKNLLNQNQKFLCIEGGIQKEFYDEFECIPQKTNEKTAIMYSGTLEKVTGVDMLIEAFKDIDSDSIELIITGRGSLDYELTIASEQDHRIKYLGCLKYEEYINCLKQADVLVNPRNMNLPENRNNFPSKILDYLATGKRIISTKFSGWEKYEEYINFADSSIDSLKCMLCTIVNEEDKIGISSRRQFAKNKIWNEQIKKVFLFLEK